MAWRKPPYLDLRKVSVLMSTEQADAAQETEKTIRQEMVGQAVMELL